MAEIRKQVKLLFAHPDTLTVEQLQKFADHFKYTDPDEELEVSIDSSGYGFTIEGFAEGV